MSVSTLLDQSCNTLHQCSNTVSLEFYPPSCTNLHVRVHAKYKMTTIFHVVIFFVFQWGGNKSLLAVNTGETVIILNEQVMNAHYNLEVSDSLSSAIVSISYAQLVTVFIVSFVNINLNHNKSQLLTQAHDRILQLWCYVNFFVSVTLLVF